MIENIYICCFLCEKPSMPVTIGSDPAFWLTRACHRIFIDLQKQYQCPEPERAKATVFLLLHEGEIRWHQAFERTMTSKIICWALLEEECHQSPLRCSWCVSVMMMTVTWEWCLWQDRATECVRSTVVLWANIILSKVNFQTFNATRQHARPMRARFRLDGPMRAE